MSQFNCDHLKLEGNGMSIFDLERNNHIGDLEMSLKGSASALLRDVEYANFRPAVKDASSVVLFKQSLARFGKQNE